MSIIKIYIKINYFNNMLFKKRISLFNFIIISSFTCIITSLTKKINIFDKKILKSKSSEITIKINGQGEQQIISNSFTTLPDIVYCNGIQKDISETKTIIVDQDENIIKMIWNTTLKKAKNMFQNLQNIIEVDLSNTEFDTSNGLSMKRMFQNCLNLEKVTIGNNFDTNKVNEVIYIFDNCKSLVSLDIYNLKISLIDSAEKMFSYCQKIESLDLSNFDTSKVTNMFNMFYKCNSLKYLNISSFNTSLVTTMTDMFRKCYLLTSLDLSHFDTSKVTDMEQIFKNCISLKYLDISNFDTSSCTNIKGMFSGCLSLTTLNLKSFNTSKVVNMNEIFFDCISLISLDISNFDTSFVTDMGKMFTNCALITSFNLSNFQTNLVSNMNSMFNECKDLIYLDIINFDTSLVNDMSNMFANCEKLTSLYLNNFNSSNAKNMEKMFYNCNSLITLNLSNFAISSTTNMISMFEGCENLDYINLYSLIEKEDLNVTNIFTGTPDDFIYCINNEKNIPQIFTEIKIKECAFKDCEYQWENNKINRFESKKYSIEIFDDKCVFKYIKEISEDFILTDKIPDTTIYTYEINSNIGQLSNEYNNLTFVQLSKEQITTLKEEFGLYENETIYLLVIDLPSNDSMTATSSYDFKLILENGTVLNLNNINIDLYVNISVPIRNLDISNFKYAEYFSNEGYDIYNKQSDFYNDFCTSASIDNNDITIDDRKKEIFPNNVTLCRSDCNYVEVDINNKRIICECNLNKANKNITSDNNNYVVEENNGNFLSYFLDNFNFKPFKCSKLLFSFNNYKYSYIFYTLLFILLIIIVINAKFFIYKTYKIRLYFFKELPDENKMKRIIEKELAKRKSINNNLNLNVEKKRYSYKNKIFKDKSKNLKTKKYSQKSLRIEMNINMSSNNKMTSRRFFNINTEHLEKIKNLQNKINKKTEKEMEKENINDINEMPYSRAIRIDKRNIVQIFKSIIFVKLELINLIFGDQKVKEIILLEYILSLLINFFFNALLYSDDIVSHKYHNNGSLDFIVTFIISILSNVITSIICYFLEYSSLIEERLEQIVEIKKEYKYLKIVKKFFKSLKIKMIIFCVTELIIYLFSVYYIVIFCIIYNKSQTSLLLNYLISLLEEIIKSLFVTIIIVLIRKIGIICSNPYLYNTSKYINEHF